MIAICESRPYSKAMITVPDKTFPKRRSDNENGTAISPIRLIGNKNGSGLNKLVNAPTLLYLILLNCIRKNVITQDVGTEVTLTGQRRGAEEYVEIHFTVTIGIKE